MITISRSQARQILAVFRRAGFSRPADNQSNAVLLHGGPSGLEIRASSAEVAIACNFGDGYPAEQFAVPFVCLKACEGSRNVPVNFQLTPTGKVQVTWIDRGVPQTILYDDCQAEIQQPFPELPETFVAASSDLVSALRDASTTAEDTQSRYALDTLQLCGARGEIAATDSSQLLVQSGFQFPWTDDVLIRRSGVFAATELRDASSIEIGRTPTHVVIRTGTWTLFLKTIEGVRFPHVQDIIPNANSTSTRCRLESQDAAFLSRTLPRLPARIELHSPVTLDLNGHVSIRSKAEDQTQTTELVLSRSQVIGAPVRVQMNRCFLERMVELGFSELLIQSSDAPFLCEDDRRKYIWQALDSKGGLAPSPDAVRIESAHADRPEESLPVPANHNRLANRSPTMTRPHQHGPADPVVTPTNGHAPALPPVNTDNSATAEEPVADPIHEAESLRDAIRTVLIRTNRLVAALRRQKKQSRLVANTLASLRQLQSVS